MRTTKLRLTPVAVGGSRFYQVTFPILPKGRGRRTFKSKAEAQTFVELKRVELVNHGVESATITTQQRGEYLDALQTLAPFGVTLREAIEVALPFLRSRSQSCPVREAVARMIESKRGEGRSQRHLADLVTRLGVFAESFGERLVSDLTAPDIERWLVGRGVGAQSRNNYRRVIGSLCAYAARMGWRETANPALAVPAAKVTRRRPAILHARELSALLHAAAPEILPALAIGGLAGLRRAEIERLDWRHVKLARGFIDVGGDTAKTGQRRLVPICESLATWLASCAQESGPVAPRTFAFNQFFSAARMAANLKDQWSGNELRHSYASARLAVTKNAALVAEELGNSVAIVRAHYAEVLTPEEGAAFFAVKPDKATNVVQFAA